MCQTATSWDLPIYWITIWMIDDVMLIFVSIFDNLGRETGGLELVLTNTLVIKNESTNQVC